MDYTHLRFPGGKFKAMTLSYDDGVATDEKLIEIVDKYGLKVTLNINSMSMNNTADEWRLSCEKLKELIKNGHEIAVHGARHLAPGLITTPEILRDFGLGREQLEEAFGGIIRGMAYPDSGITRLNRGVEFEEIKTCLKLLGIAYSRTLAGDNNSFELPTDFYAWMPTCHHNNSHLFDWLDEFLNKQLGEYRANRAPMLFYLWGHSYEFKNDDNWDRLEQFCQKAGGREDIWYATNIEICDYVEAFRNLKFSLNGKVVYNPTVIPVWFENARKIYCVESGKYVTIE